MFKRKSRYSYFYNDEPGQINKFLFASEGEGSEGEGSEGEGSEGEGSEGKGAENKGSGSDKKAVGAENKDGSLFSAKKDKEDDISDKEKEVKLFAGKYKSIEDFELGHKELVKKLTESGKIAPENYEVQLKDGIPDVDVDNDPLFAQYAEKAKQHNLSQEAFNDLLNLKLGYEMENTPNPEEELEKLGRGGTEILKNLDAYLQASLDEDQYEALLPATATAAGVQALEALRKKTVNTKLPSGGEINNSAVTEEEAEEAAAKAREAADKGSPDAARLQRIADEKFALAYPD